MSGRQRVLSFFMVYSFLHLCCKNYVVTGPFRRLSLENAFETNNSKRFEVNKVQTNRGKSKKRRRDKAAKRNQKQHQSSPFENIKRICWFFHIASICWNTCLLCKYLVLVLIDYEPFASYRYLSCFLIGRLLLNERTIEFSKYFVLFSCSMRLIWLLLAFCLKGFYLECLNFLLRKSYSDLLLEDSCALTTNQWQDRREDSRERLHTLLVDRRKRRLSTARHYGPRLLHKRLNRTADAWQYLNGRVVFYAIIVLFIAGFIGLFILASQLPLLVTWRGFRLNYEHCLNYIAANERDIQTSRWRDFYITISMQSSTAMEANHSKQAPQQTDWGRQFFMGFDELIVLNKYQLMRISWEIWENLVLVCETLATLASPIFIVFLVTDDLLYYSERVNERMRKLKCRLEFDRSTEHCRHAMNAHIALQQANRNVESGWLPIGSKCGERPNGGHINDEEMAEGGSGSIHEAPKQSLISDECAKNHFEVFKLQLMIADLFYLTRSYNRYASELVELYIMVWISLSIFVASWMFTPGNFFETSKLECYILHFCATILSIVTIGRLSLVRKNSIILYKLIVASMALENDCLVNKLRWSKLTRYYQPTSMHCFTAFNSTEVSWFFSMKLLAWLFSSLFLASTFYNHFR